MKLNSILESSKTRIENIVRKLGQDSNNCPVLILVTGQWDAATDEDRIIPGTEDDNGLKST